MNSPIDKYLYYDHGNIQIYCADCRDVLPYLESVDLIVTSPPYNVGKKYENMLSEDEYYNFLLSVFVQIIKILKDDECTLSDVYKKDAS